MEDQVTGFVPSASAGDRELARRLQERDPQAMAELYEEYGQIVFSLIVRIVRDEGVAEDVTEETFLRVWNRVVGFDAERGSLGAWVLTVARNRAIDYWQSVEGRDWHSAIEYSATEAPAMFIDLEAGLLAPDRAPRLRAAFARLTDRQRTVMEMTFFEGLTLREMSGRLKQPLDTVTAWVATSLQELRAELRQDAAPEAGPVDLFELYVMGQLEDPGRARIDEDLRQSDPEVRARLREALGMNTALALLAPPVEPSKQLRRRVMSIADPDKSRWLWTLGWVLLSSGLIAGLIYTSFQRHELELKESMERTSLDFISLPETRLFHAGSLTGPAAKVFVNPTGILLAGANLRLPETGGRFALWVLPREGASRPAGMFVPQAGGTALHLHRGGVDLATLSGFALTIEPSEESAAPTSAPLLLIPAAE
jgi:RNA polymerase sigma-70 factor (ECF subfamily)